MPKLIPIIVRLDGSQAKAEISSIGKGLDALNNRAARQFTQGGSASIDTRQMQDFVRLSKESARINEINARTQGKLAEETAKQVTQAKQSELRNFENAEKSKQNIAQTTATHQARIGEEIARRQTQQAKIGLKVFEDGEKSKQRIAEISARSQAKQTEIAMRSMEAARRRDFQDAQRIAREKAALAVTKESKYGAGDIAGIVGTAIGGSTAVAGIYAVLKAGTDYQRAMNIFQASTSATNAEMEKASSLAVALGNDLSLPGISAKDSAEAMTELAKGGLTAKQSMDATRGTLMLSIAANISAAEAAEITANALNMFSLRATESGRVADLLAASANAASGEITDHAQALQQAGAVYAAAKVPIQDVVTLIAEMAKNGIKGSDAGTSLKTMMQRLQSPTTDAAAAMKKLNVDIYDQAGAMRPMRDIITQFEKGLHGLTQEQRDHALNTIFGADAVRAATIVIKEGATGFDTMSAAVNKANSAQILAEARSKGLGGAWENLKSQAETLGLTVFNSVAPALTSVVLVFANFVGLVGQYPATFAAAATAVGLLAVAMNAVSIAASIQAMIAYGSSLGSLVFIAQNVVRAMFGLQTALVGLEVMVAAVAGWAALIAIIAGVAYAVYNMETAIDKANAVTTESIQTNVQALQMYKSLSDEAANLADRANETSQAQVQNGDVHDRLNAILGRLEPATQAYIRSLSDEKTQIDETTEAVKANITIQQDLLKSKLDVAAAGVLLAASEVKNTTDAITARREEIKTFESSITAAKQMQATTAQGSTVWEANQKLIEFNRSRLTEYGKANVEAEKTLADLNKSFVENNIKVIQAAQGLGYNTEQLREYFTTAGYTSQQVDILTSASQRATVSQNTLGNSFDKAANQAANATVEVFNLRQALNALTSVNQQNIEGRMFNVIKTAVDKNDLVAKAKQAKEDLKNDIALVNQYKEYEKIYNDIVNPAAKSGGGSSRINKTKKDVSDLKQQIESAMNNPQVKAFFAALSKIEGGGQFTVVGGAKANVNDPRHPGSYGMGMPGPLGWSTAAGLWQETLTNWKRLTSILNLTDFRDVNQQLKVALYLFQEAAGKKGVNGIAMLMKGQFEAAAKAGTQPWAASPYSTLPGKKRKDFLSLVEGNLSGGFSLDTSSEEITNSQRILDLRNQIVSLQTNGLQDAKVAQELEIAKLELESRETLEILKLREKLSFLKGETVPNDAEDRKAELRILQEFDRRKEVINTTIRNIAETLSKLGDETVFAFVEPTNPEEAKKFAEQWDLTGKSLDNFIQTGEQAKAEIAELAAEFDEGLMPLQKFDLQVKQLRESGKLTADQLDILSPTIHRTREALEKAAAAQWAKKLRQDAKTVSEALDGMADSFTKQRLDLVGDKSPLNDFLRSVEGIKELKIGVGSLDALKGLFAVGSQIDIEKFGQYVRWWLVLRSIVGDFDASKIDEVVSKLKEAAEGYNAVSTATNDVNFKTLKEGLTDQLGELERGGRSLTEYEKTLRQLETTYKDLTQAQKDELLVLAQEIDARQAWQKTYDEAYGVVRDSLQTLLDDGWGGFFKSILDRFKNMLLDMAAELITSKLMKLLTGRETASGGGFSFGNILNSIFGGGLLSGGGGASGSNASASGSAGNAVSASGLSGGGGGMWGGWNNLQDLRNSFTNFGASGSHGGGGSAPPGGGQGLGLSGGIALAGMGASVLGSLIGGRAGGILSSVGSGISLGASIGSIIPGVGTAIGAAVGAVGGFLAGLLGGDPKRKIDKKENMPALGKGFAEAMKELKALAADKNALFNDPDGTFARAKEIRKEIESGFGIKFQSKKYKGIAKNEIDRVLAEADAIVKSIGEMSDTARTAVNIDSRLETSFASGVYLRDDQMRDMKQMLFKRRNGMLPGSFTGKDNLPSMLAAGEMVLNPSQIERVRMAARSTAGFNHDPFSFAGIPGYATGTFVAPAPSVPTPTAPTRPPSAQTSGDSKRPIVVQINLANSGLVESDIKEIIVDSMDDTDVQVKVVETYDKGKSRRAGKR